MLEITLRLYGAFRDVSEKEALYFEIEPTLSLDAFRSLVAARLEILSPGQGTTDLLSKSVFADADDILAADYIFRKSQTLSIIPPVCGG